MLTRLATKPPPDKRLWPPRCVRGRVYSYAHGRGLYLSLTNRCPVACAFCVKSDWDWSFRGQDLRVRGREPGSRELLAELRERLQGAPPPEELVFCGFGEPTMRLAQMTAVGRRLKKDFPGLPLRLNTVGLGSLVHGRDIVPELAGYLDAVSVSLNTSDPAQWERLHRPAPRWRGRGFRAAADFARASAAAGLRTRVTAPALPEIDLSAARAFAEGLGAAFEVRPLLS